MIIVTGATGFIASNLIKRLNADGFKHIIAVDKFNNPVKNRNIEGLTIAEKIDRNSFFDWAYSQTLEIEFIFHLGARTDTTEFDKALLWELNTEYSKKIWQLCIDKQIPLVYASSAATYGLGENGYEDDEAKIAQLTPLNPYGESKNEFDIWALEQKPSPLYWTGLKFFNVYGWGEFHKGRMASVIFHAYNQITETGKMKLFRSHNSDYKDGEQMRDFVFVDDVVNVMIWLMHHRKNSGIYNLGSGKARTFLDLVKSVFQSMDKSPDISFIDTPADIRDKYQYFTKASMEKLKSIGYKNPFTPLEEGVDSYIKALLKK